MGLTRADIVLRAMDRLNTQNTTVYSVTNPNDRIYRAFSDVQRRWAIDTESLSSETPFDLTAGVQDYSLADPLTGLTPKAFRIRRVRFRYSASGPAYELRAITLEALPSHYNSYRGTPAYWTTRGTLSIKLWPNPSATIPQGLLIDHFDLPDDITEDPTGDDTILPFPLDHREGLIWGMAAALCLMDAEDPTLQARYPLMMEQYGLEVDKVRDRGADPGTRPLVFARQAHDHPVRDRWANMLPSDWGPHS